MMFRSGSRKNTDFVSPSVCSSSGGSPKVPRPSFSTTSTPLARSAVEASAMSSTRNAANRMPGNTPSLVSSALPRLVLVQLRIKLMSHSSPFPCDVRTIHGGWFLSGSAFSSYFITTWENPRVFAYHSSAASGLLTRIPTWSIPPRGTALSTSAVTFSPSSFPPSLRSNSNTVMSGSRTNTDNAPRVPEMAMPSLSRYSRVEETDLTPKLMWLMPGNFSPSAMSMRRFLLSGAG
mmetsp:Transcript_34434/g.71036  ORF Transcript_34434/g.71036 Transcript_34434/m.71036 type:complete len:234 (+) Transcript_34434:98-799(+)